MEASQRKRLIVSSQITRVDELDFAKIDLDRPRRCGVPEVIYCEGKTSEQVCEIIASLKKAGQDVFATRVTREMSDAVLAAHPDAVFHDQARAITIDVQPQAARSGRVAVVCAGTSDIPVAEEACLTVERMGGAVTRFYDVGVAGLHRLMPHVSNIRSSRAVIVVAGMEGALPSVVGGLIDKPIIAVPTSVGYGLSLEGVTTFLAMLNSCVPGVTVVNVDNGFGAGVAAAMINRGSQPACEEG